MASERRIAELGRQRVLATDFRGLLLFYAALAPPFKRRHVQFIGSSSSRPQQEKIQWSEIKFSFFGFLVLFADLPPAARYWGRYPLHDGWDLDDSFGSINITASRTIIT
jgi:hypothetical protein